MLKSHSISVPFQQGDYSMLQAVRGMQDILPSQAHHWQQVENQLQQLAKRYAYQEIRFPILEKTDLFHRSMGEMTDIIEKEIYSFPDSKGQMLSLRPEGTAGCVRAAIEQGLLGKPQRLWYLGPMFRHERPQKGRYRQFHQFGIEAFGMKGPYIEAEHLLILYRLWEILGIQDQVSLELNSLGETSSLSQYRAQLVDYFTRYQADLDVDSKRRLQKNPLRILDSKNPQLQDLINAAPKLSSHLDSESYQHFQDLQDLLKTANIPFTWNQRLVRGLDYYNKTVFEWIIQGESVAQNTVCAGGRYDHLVAQLGGPHTPAAGFAIGLERLIQLKAITGEHKNPDIYLILGDQVATTQGLALAENLRTALPNLNLEVDCLGGRFTAQFKRADKSCARLALILGPDEVQSNTIGLKSLRTSDQQKSLTYSELIAYLQQTLPL